MRKEEIQVERRLRQHSSSFGSLIIGLLPWEQIVDIKKNKRKEKNKRKKNMKKKWNKRWKKQINHDSLFEFHLMLCE